MKGNIPSVLLWYVGRFTLLPSLIL